MTKAELDYIQSRVDRDYSCDADTVCRLLGEIDRLKRGDFTPEEFQNLCHHRDEKPGCTRKDFEEGCQEYQTKLFGATLSQLNPTGDPKYGQ